MATFAPYKSGAPAGHIERFERKIGAAKQVFANLPRADFYDQLYVIIHRPGWTTVAESLFFEAALDSIMAQTQHLALLHQQLLNAAHAVGDN